MSYLLINGGRRICGESFVQGAKNSVLPILASTILVDGECVIKNCPCLTDVGATVNILKHLGCKVKKEKDVLITDGTGVSGCEIPYLLMREMRSSVIFLGAILARQGKVKLSAPGGCEIGLRPIDLHLSAMKKLGADIDEGLGVITCTSSGRLKGTDITLSFPSVGATENIIIAASTAEGLTRIFNAAREPEITDLADFLNSCGADIKGAGESTVYITGVKKLYPAEHRIIPDRIAAATLLSAAAMTGGDVYLKGIVPGHLTSVINVFDEAGCEIKCSSDSIHIAAADRIKAVKIIRTMPYPGFPTDIQSPVAAMLSIADGTSCIIETVFESRYKYIGELLRFGTKIRVDGRMAVIEGVKSLSGTSVSAPDLRGGAALVLAGLSAEGQTRVYDIKHIDRGYENIELTLNTLSADVKRIDEYGQKSAERQFADNAEYPCG